MLEKRPRLVKTSFLISPLCYSPQVLYLQSSDQYLTVSKGGKVVLWQEVDLSVLSTCRLQNSTVASRDLWVTDVVLLQNVQKVSFGILPKLTFHICCCCSACVF